VLNALRWIVARTLLCGLTVCSSFALPVMLGFPVARALAASTPLPAMAASTPLPAMAASTPLPAKEPLDRETPRRTMQGFLREAKEGDFRLAADYLDLRAIPGASRDAQGPDLSQKLAFILERQPTLDLSGVPDVAEGDPTSKTPGEVIADTLYAGEEPVPIELKREHFPDGVDRWLIDQKTVGLIPVLDGAYGPRSIGKHLPPWLTGPTFLGNELWQWIGTVLAVPVAYGFARLLAALFVLGALPFARRTPTGLDDALVLSARRPLRMILGALLFRVLYDLLQLTTSVDNFCGHASFMVLVFGIAWLLLSELGTWMLFLEERATRESFDLFAGRRIRTQAILVRRLASVAIGFVAVSIILLQFDFVRNVGVSLLASAGVLGVVLGFAAQKSLSAIVSGIQFSLAQPVRMGDQIVVEGDFGDVEAINLTYVVVRYWDKRRLILPITYFLEKPFQNWTHSTTDLEGTVFLKVAFTLPLDVLRIELRRICEDESHWDKRTCKLQATDSDANTVTVRALVSAETASNLWNLRCNVREKLLAFVQSYEGGKHLPQSRHALAVAGSGETFDRYLAGPSSASRQQRGS
jgi:small-conductance mechanosensitive channel